MITLEKYFWRLRYLWVYLTAKKVAVNLMPGCIGQPVLECERKSDSGQHSHSPGPGPTRPSG